MAKPLTAAALGAGAATSTGAGAKERLWTRDYVLTLASLHLFFLSWSLLFGTLPLYLEGAAKWQVGWVVGGAFGVASIMVRPFSGRITDQRGRRPVILVGASITAVMMAAHALTADILLLTPVRFIFAAGMCLYTTSAMAQMADVLPASRRGEGMGWYGVLYTLTNVYGPWLGIRVAGAAGMGEFFWFAALVAAGAGMLALPLSGRHHTPSAVRQPFIARSAVLPSATFASLAIAFSVMPAFLALYVKQLGFGNAGLFFLLQGITLVPARWSGGMLADRFGRNSVILPGLGGTALALLLLATASSTAHLYLAALVFGAGFGLGHTGLTILTMDRAAPQERGAAMATFSGAWDIGTLGAFALGFVGDSIGLSALFLAAAGLPVLAAVLYRLALSRQSWPVLR